MMERTPVTDFYKRIIGWIDTDTITGDQIGRDYYQRIVKDSKEYLKQSGIIFFEIGFDQAKEVSDILKDNGFIDIVVKKDLAMNDRVIYAKKG